uniref:Pribosyltran_N domain-containing protein n=1 Tax=Steinernema glaseri TaxID=37863 RepID=A0A1I8AQM9_9BILA
MPRSVDEGNGMVMLTGNSHPDLAKLVCDRLGIGLARINVYKRSNTETAVDISESVRGKHVFILQSSSKDVNNDLMETLTLIYACKTSSAKAITVVMPFLPYSKQCRMLRRSAITMKLVADMICKCGATRLVSLDLYKKEIQGFFGIPVDNLRASPFLLQYVRENIPDYRNGVIVAKSPGVMHKATSYADRLRLAVAVIHGEDNKDREDSNEDGRQSPPPMLSPTFDASGRETTPKESGDAKEPPKEKKTNFFLPQTSPSPPPAGTPASPPGAPSHRTRAVSSTAVVEPHEVVKTTQRVRTVSTSSANVASYELFPLLVAKEKPPLTVVGDVDGRIAFLVDDIVDEVQPFVSAAEILKRNGAKKVYVLATHGLLSADAPELIENSHIDQVIVTNTVPHELQKSQCHKITTVDISLMLCEAIRRIYHKESMGVLFKDVTIDD